MQQLQAPRQPPCTLGGQLLTPVCLSVEHGAYSTHSAALHHLSTGSDTLCSAKESRVGGREGSCTHFYRVFHSPKPTRVSSQNPHEHGSGLGEEHHGGDSCQTTAEVLDFSTGDPLLSSILRGLQICSFALQEDIPVTAAVPTWTAHCAAL